MNIAMSLPVPTAVGSLEGYIQTVNRFPVLSQEEEFTLATRFKTGNDLDAARELVLSHLRVVVSVARGFAGYGLPQADLIQEGNIGLMKAVKHYDPARKVRLMSFAIHWIRAEMFDYILRNWRIVKVATTKSQRKLFFNLRKSRERLGWMTRGEVERLSEKLDVSPETVQEMEGRMSHADIAFDADNDSDDDSFHAAPAGYLQDMRYNPEVLATQSDQEDLRQTQLRSAPTSLDARSRDIIQRRWLDEKKPTLHELADEYGISAERIRQIEMKALDVMKDALEA